MVDGDDVRKAATACRDLLRPEVGRSWDDHVPDLDMSVRGVVAHVAQCFIWYAVDLTAAGRPLEVINPVVDRDGPAPELIEAVDVCATLLAQAIDTAPADRRGFHPFGAADPSGFAAMGCDEALVHTADVAAAFGIPWRGDDGLAAAIVGRLFPWAPPGHDPWDTLLWCNGRRPLGHFARLHLWRWHCAPLSEWDGSTPSFVTAATDAPAGTPGSGRDGRREPGNMSDDTFLPPEGKSPAGPGPGDDTFLSPDEKDPRSEGTGDDTFLPPDGKSPAGAEPGDDTFLGR